MNKQQILQLTGLSEDQFYDQYPDQETFCNDYPEACAQLEQAQGGMQVGVTYDSSGNPVDISPDVTPSQWQTVDGMYTRPHTVDRFGNPIALMTSVTRQPVDRVPFNRAQPMDVITPMIARYTLPKGMVDNTMPIEKFSAKQTMQQVGSIGKSYSVPVNKYQSIVDLLKSKGMDASFSSRKELAKQLGIDNYTGTATQNMTLLNLVADNSDQMKYGGITKYQPGGSYKSGPYVGSDPKIKLSKHPFADRYINPPAEPEERTFFGTASQFIPGYETYLDVKDIATGTFKGNKAQRNQGIIGLGQPFAGKAISGGIDYLTEKFFGKEIADQIADKREGVVNMSDRERMELFKRYGYGGYDKWVKDGKPKLEQGGTNIFPAMRNFRKGGYYGMDQKFHPNSDSGTYVGGAGYYFQPGGTNTTPATSTGINSDGSFAGDQFSQLPDDTSGGMMMNDSASDNSYPDYGNQSFNQQADNQQDNQQANTQQQAPYDASQYSSEIDPSTGFTRYKKNNLVLKNIKKQDPALWEHLKEEGHGARWQTGQTDIQKFGRTAGAIGKGLENAIDVAGMIGGYLNNRQQQRNMDKAAMNMGSTASMFTNPEESSKGVVGVVGSSYGMFKPNKTGDFSYQGMVTGKYGMEVPKYAVGGFEPQLDVLENYKSIGPEQNTIVPFVESYNSPLAPVDNTRVAPPTVPLDVREQINNSNVKISNIPNPKGKDIATRLNNPGNIIYTPIFGKMFGAVDSGIKQADGSGHFAAFPDVQTGLKARETQLFGNVDGIFQSRYYKPNTDINYALKKWSGGVNKDGSINNKGYGVEIYPQLKGKTLAEITPQERKELMKRQIKQESGSMYRYLQSIGTFKDGGQQNGGQVVEMDENEIKQFLAAGGQLEFLD